MHFFESPRPGLLYGKINWRVVEPDGEFLEKNALQRFEAVPGDPGLLLNHDNEYLHYQARGFSSGRRRGEGGPRRASVSSPGVNLIPPPVRWPVRPANPPHLL